MVSVAQCHALLAGSVLKPSADPLAEVPKGFRVESEREAILVTHRHHGTIAHFPGWGLKIKAAKTFTLLEPQAYEKSEWLGLMLAKWSGIRFEKMRQPEKRPKWFN